MNSMNSIIDDIKNKFKIINSEKITESQVAFDIDKNEVHSFLSYIKSIGWRQLSLLTCVDWILDNEFELVYVLFNWDNGIRIQVRTRIDREKATYRTITNIYPGAKYYERDVHEFFGVKFEGNPDSLKQLFLENWDDIPPLRKDFDSKAYSDKKYSSRTYNKNFNNKAGETI